FPSRSFMAWPPARYRSRSRRPERKNAKRTRELNGMTTMRTKGFWSVALVVVQAWCASLSATEPHPWLPPYGIGRVGQGTADVQADVAVRVTPLVNPVDLGAILPPHGWILVGPRQTLSPQIAAFVKNADQPAARVRAWFESRPGEATTLALALAKESR